MNGGIVIEIGEVTTTTTGRKEMEFTVKNKQGEFKYITKGNVIASFDLVRKFERGDYKVGTYIEFAFFKDVHRPLPNVWRIYNVSSKIPAGARYE